MTNPAIRAQLDRMLASKTFAKSGRQAQFLRFIVERAAEGNGEPAKEYTIAVDVFARSADYNPQIDSLVRVEASKLRTRLAKYYQTEGREDPVRIEIPLGGYAPVFHDQSASARAPTSSRRYLFWAVGAAMITAAVLVPWRPGTGVIAPAPPVSVAVLPFNDLSPESDQAFFCDGVTEELTHALARLRGLRVPSTQSSSRYRGRSVDVRQVGKDLNVHAVLEGSVRREGNRIRLTAQLIETRAGFHLWSETYDREVQHVLEVQREIASAIAREFHIDLTGDRRALVRPHSADIEAYQFYLRAAHLAADGEPESVTHAVEHYRMALARDRGYALAWAGLSLAYATLLDLDMGPWQRILANCRETAFKAVSLAPALAESQQAMARYLLYGEWDWHGAARGFRRAMEFDPSYVEARYEYARTMNVIGRHQEAVEELRRGIALDPTAGILWHELGNSYIKAGRYDEAAQPLAVARKLVKRAPAYATMLGMVAVGRGHYAEAIPHFQEAMRILPGLVWPEAYLGYCYARLGRVAEASAVVKRLAAPTPNRSLPEFEIGAIYAGLGQTDRAFEWLHRAYRRRSSAMAKVNVDLRMQTLRSDPRFASLLKRMRLIGE